MAELQMDDGATLAYRDTGHGAPLVFLHGWGMCGEIFAAQRKALDADFRVVTVDLRGHGRSSPVTGKDGIDRLSADIDCLLDRLDLHDAVVVGWSMGAMVAWGLTAVSRLAGLVVVDMVPKLLNDTGWVYGLRVGADAQVFARSLGEMRDHWDRYVAVWTPRVFARGELAQRKTQLDQVRSIARANDPESLARLWVSLVETDRRDAVKAFPLRTLIVHGAQSQLYTSDAAAWLTRACRFGQQVRFEASGHAPHLEEPDRFNRVIRSFANAVAHERINAPDHPFKPIVLD